MNLLTIRTNTLWLKWILTILALSAYSLSYGQLWQNFYTFGQNAEDRSYSMLQLKDQGYLLVGRIEDVDTGDGDKDLFVVRTDVDGRELWNTTIDPTYSKTERGLDVVEDEAGNLYIVGELDYFTDNTFDIFLVKLDNRGNLLWEQAIGSPMVSERGTAIALTSDNHLIISGSKESTPTAGNGGMDAYLAKFDLDGTLIWDKTYGFNQDDTANDILVIEDGNGNDLKYAITGRTFNPSSNTFDIFLTEVSPTDGELLGTFNVISTNDFDEEAKSFIYISDDQSYLIAGNQKTGGSSSDMIWTRISVDETIPFEITYLWQEPYTVFNGPANLGEGAERVIQTQNGSFAIIGFEEVTMSNIGIRLIQVDEAGNFDGTAIPPYYDDAGTKSYFVGDFVERPEERGFAITGTQSQQGDIISDIFLFRTGPQGSVYNNMISGQVYLDDNLDCGYDPGEPLLANWRVQATNQDNGEVYYSSTTDLGAYQLVVPVGNYELTILSKNDYWDITPCNPIQSVSFTAPNQDFAYDFGVVDNANCTFPYLEINTSTLGVDCNLGEANYEVLVSNYGAFTSTDATVEVLLDEKFEFVAASIPGTVTGNQIIFDIDDLATNENQLFTVSVSTDCSQAINDQAYEFKASIVDADLCDPDGSYDFGAYSLEATCLDESSIEVKITNTGNNEVEIAEYIIIEDILIGIQEPDDWPITIEPGDDTKDTLTTIDNVNTFRFLIPQPDGYPGRSIPTDFLEGCADDGNVNTGFVLNFLEDDGNGFTAIDIQENKALPSGNYMEVTPRGLPSNNAVANESGLKYRIYFENESDETAYTMTIRDTLPAQTILVQEGNSSHPYTFDVYENNVVRFTYDEVPFAPGEQGYVEFKIFVAQDGSTDCEPIENNALIIFENQEPILTNTVNNELCGSYAEFVEIVDTPLAPTVPDLDMKIYPNPFQTECTIELEGADIYFWSVELYTTAGQLVQQYESNDQSLTINRQDLESGVYLVKILADNQVVKSAKLVVQ